MGGFSDRLIIGEDIEFCNRIIKHHRAILYSPEVVVFHHQRKLFRPFFRQRFIYGFSVPGIIKERREPANFFYAVPLIFLLSLSAGFIGGLFNKTVFFIWLIVIVGYLLLVLFESIRYSFEKRDVPLIFAAITIGNLVPGIGTLASLLRISVNIKKAFAAEIVHRE